MSKKKAKKGKLPKKIAGIKLPKEARRQAEKAIAELKQPIVREMIAGAVGMAATALAKQAAARSAPEAKAAPKPEAEMAKPTEKTDSAQAGRSDSGQFAEIATGLAMAGLGKFFEKLQTAVDAKKADPKT